MKLLTGIVLYTLFFLQVQCTSNFTYKTVPARYTQFRTNDTQRNAVLNSLKHPFRLEKSLPLHFVKNGSVDYTVFLQKGINNHADVIFPDFPVLINAKGLNLKSNTKIYFPENAKLILQPNNKKGYQVLNIKNAQHIALYYPNIIGDKTQHLSTSGVWGFGISVQESSDIYIESPTVSQCHGDGIYIGGSHTPSGNIYINNALVDNNMRNGLSITSGINIHVNASVFSNTNGAPPECGIDVEPNNNQNEMQNITITKTITFNNQNAGLLINLVNLKKGILAKQTSIDINDHIDDQSGYGMGVWLTSKKRAGTGLSGNINVVNAQWLQSRLSAYQYFENDSVNVEVVFKNLKIYKNNQPGIIDTLQVLKVEKYYAEDKHFKFTD